MASATALGREIMVAGMIGNNVKLNDLKERFGDGDDETEFRRICEVYSDFWTGRTVLHFAAENGHLVICEFLIEIVKAEIDFFTYLEDTPLLLAAKEERLIIVEYLINHGARVQMSNAKGFTCLHYAVQKDNKELMEFLVLNGAHIDADSVDGTPLHCAATRGSVEAVKLLLHYGAEPISISTVLGSPLICAINSHSLECMELLLEAGTDPNNFSYGLSPLAHAAKEGDTQFLNSLLNAGANPDLASMGGMRPIEVAALAHNLECVGILFPKTKKIPGYPNWSVDGIMEHCHSEEVKTMREENRRRRLARLDNAGRRAVSREGYNSAIHWYSEAVHLDPLNPIWLSNRSLCYVRVGRSMHALRDAYELTRLDPECPKAHYRVGSAWKLSKNYYMAALAFEEAFKLAPHNVEVHDAYSEALYDYYGWMCERYPAEMARSFQQFY